MQVPVFEAYYASINSMSSEQLSFYNHLESGIKSGNYLDVEGNISYLFIYAYNILKSWEKRGYEAIYVELIKLAEAYYHEEKFSWYCNYWSYDCLLALEKYEEFLVLTEPEDLFSVNTHYSNLRCNVCFHLGQPAKAIDLFKMFGSRVTKYTKQHSASFRDFLEASFAEGAENNGEWLNRLLEDQYTTKNYGCYLFGGAPIGQPKLKFHYYCFYANYGFNSIIQETVRVAENRLREANKIPKVGEGWVSETALYYAIKEAFPQTKIVQHGNPEWLGKQHLDIWIPNWKIAIEYQGKQHFEPVEIFGGIQGLEATIKRDIRKKKLCRKNNVSLIEAIPENSYDEIIEKVKQLHAKSSPII